MTRVLDLSVAGTVSEIVLELLESEGYSADEAIPGLVQAIVELADNDDDRLDEAANLLADGGIDDREPDREFFSS